MALLTPPPAAPQRGDRTTFANRVDAFITWLINFVTELVALVANLNSIAAGGAYAIPYTYSSNTNLYGTSAGGIAAFTSLTNIFLDTKDSRGVGIASVLLSMTQGISSSVKGQIRVVKSGDPTTWILFNLMSYTQNGGGLFGVATVDAIASSGGGLASFQDGDGILLHFQRTGDKGDTGSAANLDGPMLHVREELGTGTYPNVTSGASRNLNTVKVNTISGASLSSGVVTLPAGTYTFEGYSPLSANGVAHRVGLYNNTAGSLLSYGAAVLMANNSNGDAAVASVRGRFTLSAQSVVSLVPALFGTTSSTGGFPMSVGTEVYAELILRKVA